RLDRARRRGFRCWSGRWRSAGTGATARRAGATRRSLPRPEPVMPSYRYDIAGHLFEADHVLSEQEAQQLLDQFQPQAPAAAAPPAQAPQGGGQPSVPGLGTPSDMLQVGVPLALRAAGMMRNPLALAATALASRVLPALFTKPPAGETPRSEVGRQVKLGAPGEALGLGL